MRPLPASALDKLAFMAGHWRCEREDIVIEEMWLAPSGGVAQGTVRLVEAGKVGTIELIVVSAEHDRVVMRYNHFDRDLHAWEDDGPIALTLTALDGAKAVFSNLTASPRHAEEMGYELTAPDGLISWVVTLPETYPNGPRRRARHAFTFHRVN
jgi:hypothetical protein